MTPAEIGQQIGDLYAKTMGELVDLLTKQLPEEAQRLGIQ
jgi:hypothetical protein